MKNEVKIVEKESQISNTGKFFRVYINGQFVAMRTTREGAEESAKKILEKKNYRS